MNRGYLTVGSGPTRYLIPKCTYHITPLTSKPLNPSILSLTYVNPSKFRGNFANAPNRYSKRNLR